MSQHLHLNIYKWNLNWDMYSGLSGYQDNKENEVYNFTIVFHDDGHGGYIPDSATYEMSNSFLISKFAVKNSSSSTSNENYKTVIIGKDLGDYTSSLVINQNKLYDFTGQIVLISFYVSAGYSNAEYNVNSVTISVNDLKKCIDSFFNLLSNHSNRSNIEKSFVVLESEESKQSVLKIPFADMLGEQNDMQNNTQHILSHIDENIQNNHNNANNTQIVQNSQNNYNQSNYNNEQGAQVIYSVSNNNQQNMQIHQNLQNIHSNGYSVQVIENNSNNYNNGNNIQVFHNVYDVYTDEQGVQVIQIIQDNNGRHMQVINNLQNIHNNEYNIQIIQNAQNINNAQGIQNVYYSYSSISTSDQMYDQGDVNQVNTNQGSTNQGNALNIQLQNNQSNNALQANNASQNANSSQVNNNSSELSAQNDNGFVEVRKDLEGLESEQFTIKDFKNELKVFLENGLKKGFELPSHESINDAIISANIKDAYEILSIYKDIINKNFGLLCNRDEEISFKNKSVTPSKKVNSLPTMFLIVIQLANNLFGYNVTMYNVKFAINEAQEAIDRGQFAQQDLIFNQNFLQDIMNLSKFQKYAQYVVGLYDLSKSLTKYLRKQLLTQFTESQLNGFLSPNSYENTLTDDVIFDLFLYKVFYKEGDSPDHLVSVFNENAYLLKVYSQVLALTKVMSSIQSYNGSSEWLLRNINSLKEISFRRDYLDDLINEGDPPLIALIKNFRRFIIALNQI